MLFFSAQNKFEPWASSVPEFVYDGKEGLDSVFVPTAETVSMMHVKTALLRVHQPVLVIGQAGCGKTQLCKAALASLDPEVFVHSNANFNFYTDSALLQQLLEQPLEKKAGRQFAPVGK